MNLAEIIKSEQRNEFNAMIAELDEIVKSRLLKYGECIIGYYGGNKVDRSSGYFDACINLKFRKLTKEHYLADGLECYDVFRPGGDFKGLKISL